MKKSYILRMGFLVGFFLVQFVDAQDYQKLAQSGFQFLSVVSDARGASMAEAMTSLRVGSSSLFFNPAGMAEMDNFMDVTLSHNSWIADITHYTASLAINPWQGRFGVIGFSIQSVDYGDFLGTTVNHSIELGYDDTGIFSVTAMAAGLGYAKRLSDKFSVGGQVRLIEQDLGESEIAVIDAGDTSQTTVSNKLSPFIFDFGTQFKTGIKSLVFGMSVRNFSKEVKYAREGFQAPLVFTIGISMDVLDLFNELPYNQSLIVSIDGSHHRDHPEQIKIGMDYKLLDALSLRGGYISNNDENDFSFGCGFSGSGLSKYTGLKIDYSYTPFGVFNNVQRWTIGYSW
jgi:hypothetical protein